MDELKKIMGLDGSYKVTKVEDKEDGKSTAKFIYLDCISKNVNVLDVVNIQKVCMID